MALAIVQTSTNNNGPNVLYWSEGMSQRSQGQKVDQR